jgi:hypothetical protein
MNKENLVPLQKIDLTACLKRETIDIICRYKCDLFFKKNKNLVKLFVTYVQNNLQFERKVEFGNFFIGIDRHEIKVSEHEIKVSENEIRFTFEIVIVL